MAKHPMGRRNNRHNAPSSPAEAREAPFTCGRCGRRVPVLPSGGHHRNHCPYCLYSRHVDAYESGDRASACGALMEPVGIFQRRNGEYVLVHRCQGCGVERFNRIAADDDLPLALGLPALPVRQGDHATRADDV
ncbi:MAG TPA: RNHCP domain-containing protein [Ktedonobacterales bacterium]|nr:RNHCP domain-containing protein [Ktedonobacterales bacterium]